MKSEKEKKYNSFDFAILIPVFHDQDKIKALKKNIYKYLKNKRFFICFVDDSSNKNTFIKINQLFKKNIYILKRKKKEKFSVRYSASLAGFKWIVNNIKTNHIVEIDSDLSHHPKDIIRGINKLKKGNYNLIIGSKYKDKSLVKNRKLFRILISKGITIVCKILFDNTISDYSNTFRFYEINLVKKFIRRKIIFKSPIGHLNNLLFIIQSKYKISDISTSYIEVNNESTVKLNSLIRYFIEFIYCILINKFNFKKI